MSISYIFNVMLMSLLDILPIVGVLSVIVGIIEGVRRMTKGPHLTFLLQRADTVVSSNGFSQGVSFLLAYVHNEKRRLIGDVARKITVRALYNVRLENNKDVATAAADLPWLKSFEKDLKLLQQPKSEKDLIREFEENFFQRIKVDIPQGREEILAVLFGLEQSNKLYLASNPPVELPLPKKANQSVVLTSHALGLDAAGDNLPSTFSKPIMIIAESWNNWSYVKESRLISTPSAFRNLLLRLRIGGKTSFIKGINDEG